MNTKAIALPRLGVEVTEGRKTFLSLLMIAVLFIGTVTQSACNAAQFVQQFNQYTSQIVPAVEAILAILQFAGVNVGSVSVPKLKGDVSAAQKLVSDLSSAAVDAQPGIRNQIQAQESVLNSDLQQIFTLANISNKAVQQKVSLGLTLVEQAVAEGFAIIPAGPSKAAKVAAKVKAANFSAKDFVGSFNKVLTAKSGDQKLDQLTPKLKLHGPSKARFLLRVVTFDLVK